MLKPGGSVALFVSVCIKQFGQGGAIQNESVKIERLVDDSPLVIPVEPSMNALVLQPNRLGWSHILNILLFIPRFLACLPLAITRCKDLLVSSPGSACDISYLTWISTCEMV